MCIPKVFQRKQKIQLQIQVYSRETESALVNQFPECPGDPLNMYNM